MTPIGRRTFLGGTLLGTAALALPRGESDAIQGQIEKRHDESVRRLQDWIRQPSIAAENRGVNEGCALTMSMLREAGFQQVDKVPTDGQPGIFATLDAGAPRSVGLYFMYDVKQVDPAEWKSPPWDAAMVDMPGLGKAVMGRGAVNQKGPEAAFLAALHAIGGAGKKPPVNLVLVAEGEEEIGSPHFPQIVRRPEVMAALKKCGGIFMPGASQGREGKVGVALGAKGVVELELVASGAKWGRGPKRDIHSGNRPRVDSPAFHLVQALATLVTPDGVDPAIDGFADAARPLTAREKEMVAEAARRLDEKVMKREMSVERWSRDVSFLESLERGASLPTVNIEGLVAGYTGPGGKTILPHRAVAKIDLRLVPDMTFDGSVKALKAHLAKRGFGDIEVNVSGGYDPNTTAESAPIIQAALSVYRRAGIEALLSPRTGGSWPGYVFTGEPLKLAAGHFGVGHGGRPHAPDEYMLIEPTDKRLVGWDGAVRSYVDYLYELAAI